MIILDAHLPPALAPWINKTYDEACYSAAYLGLRDANDEEIFKVARQKKATLITKDSDFIGLLKKYGSPPKVIWLTCGNTSKQRLREIFERYLLVSMNLLKESDLVEISGV